MELAAEMARTRLLSVMDREAEWFLLPTLPLAAPDDAIQCLRW